MDWVNVQGCFGRRPISPTFTRLNWILDVTAKEYRTETWAIKNDVVKAMNSANRSYKFEHQHKRIRKRDLALLNVNVDKQDKDAKK